MTIRIKLSGGLGNQMFQFATGYAVARKNNVDLSLDLKRFNHQADHNGFQLQDVFEIYSKVDFLNNPVNFRFINFKEILNKIGIGYHKFKEPHFHYAHEIHSIPKHSLLNGYWQSELYFKNYSQEIRKIFSFCNKLEKKNLLIANDISKNNSISIHVRRGDYLLKQNNNLYADLSEYYNKAIKDSVKCFNDPKFFIFTDDPLWVNDNFNVGFSHTIVDVNNGSKSFFDMHLMSLCKANIIANSSFSWWGAWLNNNKNKIIYTPKNWFKNKSICTDNLIPNTWKII